MAIASSRIDVRTDETYLRLATKDESEPRPNERLGEGPHQSIQVSYCDRGRRVSREISLTLNWIHPVADSILLPEERFYQALEYAISTLATIRIQFTYRRSSLDDSIKRDSTNLIRIAPARDSAGRSQRCNQPETMLVLISNSALELRPDVSHRATL